MSSLINVKLRPFVLSDSISIAKYANNRDVSKNLRDAFPFPYSDTDALQFIMSIISSNPSTIYAIDINGEAIGAAGITLKDDVYKGNGEIGYWIGQEFWGKGISSAVVSDLIKIAFNELGLYRIYAEVFENNIASMRVLEKNGFINEAKLEKAVTKDGVKLDLYIYSKLNLKGL